MAQTPDSIEVRVVPDPTSQVVFDALFQFNEVVSLLREARPFLQETDLAGEVDDALPSLQNALVALAEAVTNHQRPPSGVTGGEA